MKVATDDAARRIEFVWLGPPESPWPFQARIKAWVLGMLLCPALVVLTFALVPVSAVVPGPTGWLLHALVATSAGVTVGIMLVRFVGRWSTPVTPLSHQGVVMLGEVAAPREPQPERLTHVVRVPADLWLESNPEEAQVYRMSVPACLSKEWEE